MSKIIVTLPEDGTDETLDDASALEFVAAVIRQGRVDEDYADTKFIKFGPNHSKVHVIGTPLITDQSDVIVSTHRNKSSDSFTVEGFGPPLDESYMIFNPHEPTQRGDDIPSHMLPEKADVDMGPDETKRTDGPEHLNYGILTEPYEEKKSSCPRNLGFAVLGFFLGSILPSIIGLLQVP